MQYALAGGRALSLSLSPLLSVLVLLLPSRLCYRGRGVSLWHGRKRSPRPCSLAVLHCTDLHLHTVAASPPSMDPFIPATSWAMGHRAHRLGMDGFPPLKSVTSTSLAHSVPLPRIQYTLAHISVQYMRIIVYIPLAHGVVCLVFFFTPSLSSLWFYFNSVTLIFSTFPLVCVAVGPCFQPPNEITIRHLRYFVRDWRGHGMSR